MLTDQEKDHILEEEVYRREIKNTLEKSNSKDNSWQKYWSILNSGLFIWFVSSIILGSASLLYNRMQKKNTIEHENKIIADKLDAEIINRLVYYNNLLIMRLKALQESSRVDSMYSYASESKKSSLKEMKINADNEKSKYNLSKLSIALERPSTLDYPINIFPEYINRNLRSLLWELMQVTSKPERESIRPAYEESLILQMIYLKSLYGEKRDSGYITATQARALSESSIAEMQFYSTFNLQRWGSPFNELLQKQRDRKSLSSSTGN